MWNGNEDCVFDFVSILRNRKELKLRFIKMVLRIIKFIVQLTSTIVIWLLKKIGNVLIGFIIVMILIVGFIMLYGKLILDSLL